MKQEHRKGIDWAQVPRAQYQREEFVVPWATGGGRRPYRSDLA